MRQIGPAVAIGIEPRRPLTRRALPQAAGAFPRRGNWPWPAGRRAGRPRASAPGCRSSASKPSARADAAAHTDRCWRTSAAADRRGGDASSIARAVPRANSPRCSRRRRTLGSRLQLRAWQAAERGVQQRALERAAVAVEQDSAAPRAAASSSRGSRHGWRHRQPSRNGSERVVARDRAVEVEYRQCAAAQARRCGCAAVRRRGVWPASWRST